MGRIVHRMIKTAALLCAATSVVSLFALFSVEPGTGLTTVIADNALLLLMASTPVAAGLLAIVSHSWARAVALCAFIPGAIAIGVVALIELVPPLTTHWLSVVAFVLVELAMPVTAALVGLVAAAVVVNDVHDAMGRSLDADMPS